MKSSVKFDIAPRIYCTHFLRVARTRSRKHESSPFVANRIYAVHAIPSCHRSFSFSCLFLFVLSARWWVTTRDRDLQVWNLNAAKKSRERNERAYEPFLESIASVPSYCRLTYYVANFFVKSLSFDLFASILCWQTPKKISWLSKRIKCWSKQ